MVNIGLGIMRIEPQDCNSLIDYALDSGVNYFEACIS